MSINPSLIDSANPPIIWCEGISLSVAICIETILCGQLNHFNKNLPINVLIRCSSHISLHLCIHDVFFFQNGWTPIMDAAMHGHAEVIKLLLEAGATAIMTKDVSLWLQSYIITLYCGNTHAGIDPGWGGGGEMGGPYISASTSVIYYDGVRDINHAPTEPPPVWLYLLHVTYAGAGTQGVVSLTRFNRERVAE